MCGIVGTFNYHVAQPVDPLILRRMLGAIRHRGPDQFGIYSYEDERCSIALGSARLSIIDLGGGQQPISNEDGSLWIIFNGEIFNHIALRLALEKQGHHFITDSDTEVIIHLFEQCGVDCVKHLNGQFAFAIWDERTRRLFIARDRFGIRPLHYAIRNRAIIFASEIKALLADRRIQARLDPITLDQIFTYWSPLSPRTAFQDIHTLPPAHWLEIGVDGDLKITPYWRLNFPEEKCATRNTVEACAEELRLLLLDATRIRLRADVPVGAYLSGGLDSSTITALIRRYTENRLETFSIAFSDDDYDESSFQRQMAERLGATHHVITCTHEDIGWVFPDVIWHTELPIMRTSPAPLFLLSELVQNNHFKVVLTGEGADEFLAGYNIFKETKIRRFWARQPDSQWRPALLNKLYPYIGSLSTGNDAYLRRFFGQDLENIDAFDYSHGIRWRNTARSKRIFSEELKQVISIHSSIPEHEIGLPDDFANWSQLARAQYLEITIFMTQYLLSSQGDRVAMAHSVEGRFPFLDHRLVEFANNVAPQNKLRGLNEKHLLKLAVRDLLPAAVRDRPKRPYRAPIHRSFFPHGQPLDWVTEMISPRQLERSGVFDPRAVSALVRKIQRVKTLGETDDMMLAGLLSTQLVHQQFVQDYRIPKPIGDDDDVKIVIRGRQLSSA